MYQSYDVPNLKFERFNPEGNSPDAVVYMSTCGLLVYEGKRYEIEITIEDDFKITEVFEETYTDYEGNEIEKLVLVYEFAGSLREEWCYLVSEEDEDCE